MSTLRKALLIFAVQLATLAAMVADKQWTLNTGTPLVLRVEPLDPRSLFMGDYARLAYPISRLVLDGPQAVAGDKDFKPRDTVWVAVKPDPVDSRAQGVYLRREDVPAGLVALKGEVMYLIDHRRDKPGQRSVPVRTLSVRYGIEQYFVREGTGRKIERPRSGEKIAVRVAVDARGKAGIQAILIDGQELYRETLF